MKYIIKRLSDLYNKPIYNATKETVHNLSKRYRYIENKLDVWKNFVEQYNNIHLDEENCWCGTSNVPTEVWVAEVYDLHSFANEYGTIILKRPDNAEGLWTIEIYDDYME